MEFNSENHEWILYAKFPLTKKRAFHIVSDSWATTALAPYTLLGSSRDARWQCMWLCEFCVLSCLNPTFCDNFGPDVKIGNV